MCFSYILNPNFMFTTSLNCEQAKHRLQVYSFHRHLGIVWIFQPGVLQTIFLFNNNKSCIHIVFFYNEEILMNVEEQVKLS